MRKFLVTVFVLLVIAVVICDFYREESYTFRQSFDSIATIDILKKEYDSIRTDTPTNVLRTLDKDEHQALWNALQTADCSRSGLEPGRGFGLYIIRITYQDGEQELIGEYNNGYVLPDGTIHQDGYFFDKKQLYDIITRFLHEKITDVPGLE